MALEALPKPVSRIVALSLAILALALGQCPGLGEVTAETGTVHLPPA